MSSSSISTNQTFGQAPNAVFGLFFCTGDLTQDNCQPCIQTAIKDITESSCPSSKQAIIWYDYCELRYSDTNFFGLPDTDGFPMTNSFENTTSSRPVEVVTQLVKEAPPEHPVMFKSLALRSESLDALAQCSSDLTRQGCSDCLTTIFTNIKACCIGAKGWRYLAPSCWIRYEATPFLQNVNGANTTITQSYCSNNEFPVSNGLNATTQIENLLSSLTEQAPALNGFYSSSVGKGVNKVYGLALCRGDLQNKEDDCQSCLKDTSKSLVEECLNNAQAIEWYEKCLVRYSNQSFFGVVDAHVGRTLCGPEQISQAAYNSTLTLAMTLINDAPNSPLFFRAGAYMSNSYVLVQCTRDLSKDGCGQCLQNGMSSVSSQCNQTNGWRYLSGSCTLRYEVNPFFNVSFISIPSPGSPQEKDGASKKKSSGVIIAAIVAPVLGVILLASILYLWWRLSHKKGSSFWLFCSPSHILMGMSILLLNEFGSALKT
ncbi:putative Gnk2-like domain-containing protein [Dioscorea sansibarensis]